MEGCLFDDLFNGLTIYSVISESQLFIHLLIIFLMFILCMIDLSILLCLLSFTLPFFLNIFLSFSWNCYCFVFLLVCLFILFLFLLLLFSHFVSPVHSIAFFCLLNFFISICEPNSFCFRHSCKMYFLVSIIGTDCFDRKKN